MCVFHCEFTLDKDYFRECFDQSLPYSNVSKPKYALVAFLFILGCVAIYGLDNAYLGNFLILLAVLECIAHYYRRPWWVARQMVTRASGSKITLQIDAQGITATNPYKSYQILWSEVNKVAETQLGVVLVRASTNQYISKKALSAEALEFILSKKNSHD
ncbi:YcxB family protein [Pseudoalteromonas rubra]|uniref:YcxB family protein n=1 Tax=Pseudoalteromonas rubra TaxID=43658 RepID=UPI00026CC23E|nr:YcxB family protein [Pseudoalteromonas rubra]